MTEPAAIRTVHTGEELELTVDRPAAGGAMIARLDGRVVFVSGAIPGERVSARVDRVARHTVHASTIAVHVPSPDRREAFADPPCGGCLYSHIAYPRQLEIKAQVIADAFLRIGKIVLPSPVAVAASVEEGYRMRARLHVRGGRLGFFRENTHDLCDARQSRQLLPATHDALDGLMGAARSLGVETIREVELSENVAALERVVWLDTIEPLDQRSVEALTHSSGFTPGPYVTDTISFGGRDLSLRRHVRAFFQGNRYLLRDLVAHVTDRIPAGTSLADLYAGAGVFAIPAAVVREALVVAVEGDRWAAEDLRANAAVAGDRVTAVRGDVESFAPGSRRIETVVVDPPRSGMSPAALARLLQLGASRVIYVSCGVATLARDARRIVDGGYAIDRVDGFDLFPNTPHVETVVVFDRR